MTDRTQALASLQKANILNTKLSLGEILETAGRLSATDMAGGPEELGWWAVVSDHYVVAGGAVDMEAISKAIISR